MPNAGATDFFCTHFSGCNTPAMSRPRIHLSQPLASGTTVTLSDERSHYLSRVLRLSAGAKVQAFNGGEDEFAATVLSARKSRVELSIGESVRNALSIH